MVVDLLIALATLGIAFNGLVYQPKKDPDRPASWSNINTHGKLLIGGLLVLAVLTVGKRIIDQRNQSAREAADAGRIEELIASQQQLKEINRHLIKVMSVADGYNAVVRGVVSFESAVSESEIRNALQNLFLKYAHIEIHAENRLGTYSGRVDYGAHPEVRKFLRTSDLDQSSPLYSATGGAPLPNEYYFEIRCEDLKILNDEKIQYARFDPAEPLYARASAFEWSRDFNRIYKVETIRLHELEIEELGTVPVMGILHFE